MWGLSCACRPLTLRTHPVLLPCPCPCPCREATLSVSLGDNPREYTNKARLLQVRGAAGRGPGVAHDAQDMGLH